MTDPRDWYLNRDELQEGMIFRCRDGSVVKLDRRVPGDGTNWYVADWCNSWAYFDQTIHPSALADHLIGFEDSSDV